MAGQVKQIGDEARPKTHGATRALRSATPTAREAAAALAAGAYALLDLCPWCKKGLGKVIPNPPFCPHCHRDMLAWSEKLQEEQQAQQKGIRASNLEEKRAEESELLRKMKKESVANKSISKRERNRE